MRDRPNIVWLLVDSIRTYSTDQDLRGKLPFMKEFGRHAVEFETCVTTAPSTIMSISAMMTGLPAYLLARNYDDFRFDPDRHDSLAGVLKRCGYASYSFLRSPETREKFANLLDPVPRKYWPPHLRHRHKWTNQDLILLLDRVLAEGVKRPAFLFFHFNPQTAAESDPEISDRVKAAYDRVQDAGFNDENTIFVLCSDHGFPDPRTGMTSEWEVKHRLSHDLILTDDNILIPLYFKRPGGRPGLVTAPVSSLDIFPTLLDLAEVPGAEEITNSVDGRSLLRLMDSNGESEPPNRYFRTDSRLMLQTGRCTSIRGREFKYVRFHDEHRLPLAGTPSEIGEILIKLSEDPREERNLLLEGFLSSSAAEILEELRGEFDQSERRAVDFQTRYLLSKQESLIRGGASGPEKKILLAFESDTAGYSALGVEAVQRVLPTAEVDVLVARGTPGSDALGQTGSLFEYVYDDGSGPRALEFAEGRPLASRYDAVISFVQDPSSVPAKRLLTLLKRVPSGRKLILDCNFRTFTPNRYWYFRARALGQRLSELMREPGMLAGQLVSGGRFILRRVLRRFDGWERWDGNEGPVGRTRD